MPEDIPERHSPLSDEERLNAASDWSDYRKDYGVSPDPDVLRREHRAFLAGWEARRNSLALTPAQQEAVEKVREFVTRGIAAVSVTEALYTDAADRAEAATLDGATPLQRAAYDEVAERLRAEQEPSEPTAADLAAAEVDAAEVTALPRNENGRLTIPGTHTHDSRATRDLCAAGACDPATIVLPDVEIGSHAPGTPVNLDEAVREMEEVAAAHGVTTDDLPDLYPARYQRFGPAQIVHEGAPTVPSSVAEIRRLHGMATPGERVAARPITDEVADLMGAEGMTDEIADMIDASSFGTPAARAARASVPDEVARRVVARSRPIPDNPQA